MKILAIVEPSHQGNTLKIAKAMADAVSMDITDTEHASEYDLHNYDIVGFGSGIYYGKHDKKLVEFIKKLCDKKAYTFVFATSGANAAKANRALADLLEEKNKIVLGMFDCRGHDKFALFKLIGGLNKGRPNEDDFAAARSFITHMQKKFRM